MDPTANPYREPQDWTEDGLSLPLTILVAKAAIVALALGLLLGALLTGCGTWPEDIPPTDGTSAEG